MEVLLLKFNLFRHLFQAYIYPPHYNERYPSLRLPIRLIWEKREPRAGWNPPSQESWSALNKKLHTGMWESAVFSNVCILFFIIHGCQSNKSFKKIRWGLSKGFFTRFVKCGRALPKNNKTWQPPIVHNQFLPPDITPSFTKPKLVWKTQGWGVFFTESAPLGRFSHRIAISVCLSVCLCVCAMESQGSKGGPMGAKQSPIVFEASNWPSGQVTIIKKQ